MHIPDGFLNIPVITTTYMVSAGTLTLIWKKIQRQFSEQSIPRVAILAAFIFIVQMINIPISGGTSGHLLGGFLAALLVGPYVGIFLISLVLTVQMFVFQDGGLTALGANILNMGIASITGSYFLYRFIFSRFKKDFQKSPLRTVTIFFCAWLAVEIGAVLCGFELSLSGLANWKIVVGLMAGVHAIIGILEGVMTVLIFRAIQKLRPDLIYQNSLFTKKNR